MRGTDPGIHRHRAVGRDISALSPIWAIDCGLKAWQVFSLETPLTCGKLCGCEGRTPESTGTERLVGIFRHCLGIPKAMFLSWLTIFRQHSPEMLANQHFRYKN